MTAITQSLDGRRRAQSAVDVHCVTKIERAFAAVTLFANGWIFALPVTDLALPPVMTPIQVVHGIFAHEVLLAAYLCFAFVARAGSIPSSSPRTRRIALLIAALGFIAIVSSAVNARPLRELASAGRYFLLAAYFMVAVSWGRTNGRTFVLRWLLAGIALSGAANLYYTFKFPSGKIGGLPLLLGQNGPGGYLGIAVLLAAWLLIERSGPLDTAVASFASAVGVVGSSISYSKLAMLMAAAGAIAFVFVVWRRMTARQARMFRVAILAILPIVALTYRAPIATYSQGVKAFIFYKFENIDEASVGARSDYFAITAEIVARHPLFGVGYGGFYDAEIQTEAFKKSRSVIEDPEAGSRGQANPHSSFLYHAAATGLPGLTVAVALFVLATWNIGRVLRSHGIPGKFLWLSLTGGYLLFGLTLPTLFNTSILYLPLSATVISLQGVVQRPPRYCRSGRRRGRACLRNLDAR